MPQPTSRSVHQLSSSSGLSRNQVVSLSAGGLMVALATWCFVDYRRWQALGKGGMPATLRGWLRTTWLRSQKRNPVDLTELRALRGRGGDITRLTALPLRRLGRPRVGAHPVPHRQVDQRVSPALAGALQSVFDSAVEANGDAVLYALSYFEKHMDAITSRNNASDPIGFASHGEIAHIHAIDGSMHMILSPSDAVCAIENGWAELHGLAGRSMGLPANYLMVYAPQTEADIRVVERLLAAAIAYMTAIPAGCSSEHQFLSMPLA